MRSRIVGRPPSRARLEEIDVKALAASGRTAVNAFAAGIRVDAEQTLERMIAYAQTGASTSFSMPDHRTWLALMHEGTAETIEAIKLVKCAVVARRKLEHDERLTVRELAVLASLSDTYVRDLGSRGEIAIEGGTISAPRARAWLAERTKKEEKAS